MQNILSPSSATVSAPPYPLDLILYTFRLHFITLLSLPSGALFTIAGWLIITPKIKRFIIPCQTLFDKRLPTEFSTIICVGLTFDNPVCSLSVFLPTFFIRARRQLYPQLVNWGGRTGEEEKQEIKLERERFKSFWYLLYVSIVTVHAWQLSQTQDLF